MIGTTLKSRYHILRELGRGGMGVVYQAKDSKLDRLVALKFLGQRFGQDKDKERFRTEATSVASIDHQNVGIVYDLDETDDGRLFIVMAYYDGSPLYKLISTDGLSISEVVSLSAQIAIGMAVVHRTGVIHRDLKPSNVFVTNENSVKIIDFGLAMLTTRHALETGVGLNGTIDYMSPEQTVVGGKVDTRSDIWSLGVTIYEMIARQRPFVSADPLTLVHSIRTLEPKPVGEIRTETPPEIAALVHKCLEKDPSQRPQTMEEIAETLHRIPLPASPETYVPSVPWHQDIPAQERTGTILYSDFANYRDIARDNPSLAADLGSKYHEILALLSPKNNGIKIIDARDSAYLEFADVADAFRCARDVQQTLREHNGPLTSDKHISVRIGLHTGNVVRRGSYVHGDAVSLAARIGLLARPGQTYLSEDVMNRIADDQATRRLVKQFHRVPKTDLPVDVFEADDAETPRIITRKRALLFAVILTILTPIGYFVQQKISSTPAGPFRVAAIIPLDSLSGTEAYIPYAVTRVMIGCVAQLPDVKVISSSSTSHFADKPIDIDVVRNALRADAAIAGSLVPVGSQYEATMKAIDLRNGNTVWRFSIRNASIAHIIRSIVDDVSKQLSFPLDSVTQHRVDRFYSNDPQVYNSYLRGIYESKGASMLANERAITYFRTALTRDPEFIPALNYLAHVQQVRYEQGWERDERLLDEAATSCSKVLTLDPRNADATAILGVIETLRENLLEGQRHSEAALALDRNNLIALTNMGYLKMYYQNKPADGVRYFKRVQELDPLGSYVYNNLGIGYVMMRDFPEAYGSFLQGHSLDTTALEILINLGDYCVHESKDDSAKIFYSKAIQNHPLERRSYERLGSLLIALGGYDEAENILTAGIRRLESDYGLLYTLGRSYSHSGRSADAMRVYQRGLYIVDAHLAERPRDTELLAFKGLFEARLSNVHNARRYAKEAAGDASPSEVMIKVARIHALLGDRAKMIKAFRSARAQNQDYDVAYLRTAPDFDRYRTDAELLAIAAGTGK